MSARMSRASIFERWIARPATTRCLLFDLGMLVALLSGCATTPRESRDFGYTLHGEPLDADGDVRRLPPRDICSVDVIQPQVAFASNSARLVPCARRVLDEGIAALNKYPDLVVEVAGHADSSEAADQRRHLSLLRAKVVYDYLTARGIDAARLLGPVGYENHRPLYPERDIDGRILKDGARRNRRVELNVQN